ncbi:ABC transporter permease [Desulfosporosinus sp.]|uniref:ABC transporter permease n=1 Tax=Desulfosporosinus sp. TaxID=157907 RepID=UPI0023148C7D|nr:ABC transporter permease [Desulfosporosinus sp.]MDA8220750.1 ABC transporter permease [Desulfitobacterium hafniense]
MMKILKKTIIYIVLVASISFLLPRLIPGSPFFFSHSDMYVLNTMMPEDSFKSFVQYYHPDKPVPEQFLVYLKDLLNFDLGRSFYYKLPVAELLTGCLGWTIFLSFVSIGISSGIGIPLGLFYAVRKGGKRTVWLNVFTGLNSVPVIVIAIVMQMLLSYKFDLFPSSGAYTPGISVSDPGWILDVIGHAILPLWVLVLAELPPIFILTYNTCSRTKNQPFVEMAKYLNIQEHVINYKYILKNTLPEILSKINIQFLYAISGVLFVEVVFSYPGIGTLLKTAACSRDYPLLQGILLVTGIYGIVINLIFELIIKRLNPRVKA